MSLRGYRYTKDLILFSVRWYLRYSLSCRDLEEILAERGLGPDHTTAYRWGRKLTAELVKRFNGLGVPVDGWGRLDGTCIRVNGPWRYRYRAVNRAGRTVDFLLSAYRRSRAAALNPLRRSTGLNSVPSLVNIDRSGGYQVGLNAFNSGTYARAGTIVIRQCTCLNHIVG